ncbi:MAG TPA: AAA family ATPase, partial [Puia sp.]
RQYQYADLLTIAKGQLAQEEKHAAELEGRWGQGRRGAGEFAADGKGPVERGLTEPILFIDTDMYVMKVWSEFVFGRCDAWILDQVATRRYDGYLLCRTDLPWTADELREYPDEGPREQLFHIYRDCMINQSTPWREIGGCEEERLTAAIAAVKEMLIQ